VEAIQQQRFNLQSLLQFIVGAIAVSVTIWTAAASIEHRITVAENTADRLKEKVEKQAQEQEQERNERLELTRLVSNYLKAQPTKRRRALRVTQRMAK
jgi:hypothetical protein